MTRSVDDPELIDLTEEERRQGAERGRPRRWWRRGEPRLHQRPIGETVIAVVRTGWRRARLGVVASLPTAARVLRVVGVLVLSFVVFVVVFGALRHTSRQRHLEEAFRTRVAGGLDDRPNWRPRPGQAIATLAIPSIGVYEVLVEDTTPSLLEGGPGHVLGTALPGRSGNAVILGRRVTDGAPFRNLAELSAGDRIGVVTPSGAFAYTVERVSRAAPGDEQLLAPTEAAQLTLVTSASWFVPEDRLVVVASLVGTPAASTVPSPIVQQRSANLGTAGDPRTVVPLLPWVAALLIGLIAWFPIRRRIESPWARFVLATPALLVLLYFVFENADNLLPGSI